MPKSESIAAHWREFEESVIARMGQSLTSVETEVARAGFYFGSLKMIDEIQRALAGSSNPTAVLVTLDGFRDEILAAIAAGPKRVS